MNGNSAIVLGSYLFDGKKVFQRYGLIRSSSTFLPDAISKQASRIWSEFLFIFFKKKF